MGVFSISYKRTMGFEAKYSNRDDDPGGETWMGISRVWNPKWDGWPIIDAAKSDPNFPACLASNEQLLQLVQEFYRREYWDPLHCDDIQFQPLVNELFDTGVNLSIYKATEWLQVGLNVLNRDQRLWPDIKADGRFGPLTLSIVKTALDGLGDSHPHDCTCNGCILAKIINCEQGHHYVTHTAEGFMRGLFGKRITL